MADELLDISKFGTLGPNQVVKDVKTSDSRGTTIQDIKRGPINVAEDFSEGFSTAAEMAVDYVADAVSTAAETGKAFASDAAETVSDAAGAAYEALPEMADVIEKVSETASNVGTSLAEFGERVANGADTLTSTASDGLIKDLFSSSNRLEREIISETFFQPKEIEGIRQVIRDNWAEIKKNNGLITKAMFKDVKVGDVRGGNDWSLLSGGKLTIGDRLYNTLGDTTVKFDEETGEYYIEDVYDWNVWVDYTDRANGTDEKTGRLKGTVYSTKKFESEVGTAKGLRLTLQSDASFFEKVHNIAFLFGSREYEDESKNVGSKMRINLGKLNLGTLK